VRQVGDIGLVKIVSESAVAAGVRRIEALTGHAARRYLTEHDQLVRDAASAIKAKPQDLPARVLSLMDEKRRLERELTEAKKALALSSAGGGNKAQDQNGDTVKTVGDVNLLARIIHGIAPKELRGLVDEGKKSVGSGIVAMIAVSEEGKAGIAVGVTKDLAGAYSAVDLVRVGSAALGGSGGGGRPDMAQAGGKQPAKLPEALAVAKQTITEMLGG